MVITDNGLGYKHIIGLSPNRAFKPAAALPRTFASKVVWLRQASALRQMPLNSVLGGSPQRLPVLIGYLVVGLSLSFLASCASIEEERTYTTAEDILYFDTLSEEHFGVSLVALSWLANWKPHSYLPLSYLQQSGEIHILNELQQASLIEIKEHAGLPDGTEKGIAQVTVVPIGKGLEIVTGFKILLKDFRTNEEG